MNCFFESLFNGNFKTFNRVTHKKQPHVFSVNKYFLGDSRGDFLQDIRCWCFRRKMFFQE